MSPTFVDESGAIVGNDHISSGGPNQYDWTFTASAISPALADGDVLIAMISSIDNDSGNSAFPTPVDPVMGSAPADWTHDATEGWSFPGSPHPTAYSRWELYSKVWGPGDDPSTYTAQWVSSLAGWVLLDDGVTKDNLIVGGAVVLVCRGGTDRSFSWAASSVGVDGVHDYPYPGGVVVYSNDSGDSTVTPGYYPHEFDLAQAAYTVYSADPYSVWLAYPVVVGTYDDGSFSGGTEIAQGLSTFHYYYVTQDAPLPIRLGHGGRVQHRLSVS